MSNPAILVIGAGPGVSGAVASRFGKAGYDVALVGLGGAALAELGHGLQADGVTAGWAEADVTDGVALRAAIERLVAHTGRLDVVHFNPSAYRGKDPLSLTVPELLEDVALGVGALLSSVQAARPHLQPGGRVTATGSIAADRPNPEAASLGVQKAALRNLVDSLDRTLAPEGIRAVSVTVCGVLDRDDRTSPFHPDRIAEAVFAAAARDDGKWTSEVRHPAG